MEVHRSITFVQNMDDPNMYTAFVVMVDQRTVTADVAKEMIRPTDKVHWVKFPQPNPSSTPIERGRVRPRLRGPRGEPPDEV